MESLTRADELGPFDVTPEMRRSAQVTIADRALIAEQELETLGLHGDVHYDCRRLLEMCGLLP